MNDPLMLFAEWFADVKGHAPDNEFNVMTLATATKDGIPSARVVLLKSFDARGFVFYTNLESRKSRELKANPQAALCFNWIARGRQVRVEGAVEQVSDAEADAYYASRPLGSRIGALVSRQSRPLASHEDLMLEVQEFTKRYSEFNPPPRPDNWSGWRVMPRVIEFWQEGKFRLHERTAYVRAGDGWTAQMLYP